MRSRWQFSLRQLFVWIALVAVFFSLRACLRSTAGGAMAVGLGIFAYLAVRQAFARASPGESLPGDAAGQQAARHKASWLWRVVVLVAALAGLWVPGVQLYVAIVQPNARQSGLAGLLLFLFWGGGGVAVGVAGAALVRLWMGGSLGRSYGCVFGLALGWLLGLTAITALGVDILGDHGWMLLVAVHEGLVAGLFAAVLLRRYSHGAAWGSAVGATAGLAIVLLVAFLDIGGTLFQSGYLHLRHLILALAGACFATLGGGIVGAVPGGFRDRRRLASPQPVSPDMPRSPHESVSTSGLARCEQGPWRLGKLRAILLKSLLGFLLVCACLAIVDLRSEPSAFRAAWDVLVEGVDDLGNAIEGAASNYQMETLQAVARRQTVGLPPVDRVEVFFLGDRRRAVLPGFPTQPFPMRARFDPNADGVRIVRQATLTGAEAEALAQLWRAPEDSVGPSFAPLPWPYGLRFYAHGCLILEVGSDYLTDGGLAYGWFYFLDADAPLFARLQEIAPPPDEYRARLAVERGSVCLATKQYDKAEAQFRQALQLRKDDPDACVGLGRALEGRGLLRDALAAYNQAAALGEQASRTGSSQFFPTEVYQYRARVHFAMRDYDQAMADLNRWIQFSGGSVSPFSDSPNPYLLRAAAHLELKAPHAAIADLDSWAQADPGDPEGPRLRAKVYHAMGRPDDAKKELQKAAELAKQRQSDSEPGDE